MNENGGRKPSNGDSFPGKTGVLKRRTPAGGGGVGVGGKGAAMRRLELYVPWENGGHGGGASHPQLLDKTATSPRLKGCKLFSVKGETVTILGFMAHRVSVTATQLSPCSVSTQPDTTCVHGHGHVAKKLFCTQTGCGLHLAGSTLQP